MRLALFLLLIATSASAQVPPTEQVRAMPRTADGKPDLNGIWQALTTANFDIQDHAAAPGVPAGQGIVEGNEIPYLPSARARKEDNFRNRATQDHEAKCFLLGVPRTMYAPFPFQIVQSPAYIAVFSE